MGVRGLVLTRMGEGWPVGEGPEGGARPGRGAGKVWGEQAGRVGEAGWARDGCHARAQMESDTLGGEWKGCWLWA